MRLLLIISMLFIAVCTAQNPLASVASLRTSDYALISYSYNWCQPLTYDYIGVRDMYFDIDRKEHLIVGLENQIILTRSLRRKDLGWQGFNALLLRRYDSNTRALPQLDHGYGSSHSSECKPRLPIFYD